MQGSAIQCNAHRLFAMWKSHQQQKSERASEWTQRLVQLQNAVQFNGNINASDIVLQN